MHRASTTASIIPDFSAHSSLSWPRKLHLFASRSESKLLYSLASACLTRAQLRKLDGFQNRCIRKIIGVKPSYISRVSNKDVLTKAGHRPISELLRKRRLQLLGKVLCAPPDHPLYTACFIPGTLTPATEQFIRRVGRPAKEWVKEVSNDVILLCGSLDAAETLAQHKRFWTNMLKDKLGFL